MTDVCVYGLGAIGLPTAALFTVTGHDVRGVDTDPAVIHRLQRGDLPTDEPDLRRRIGEALDSSLTVSTRGTSADYHVICVPTPIAGDRRADLDALAAAANAVAAELSGGETVVVESTVPPGTTDDLVRPTLERSGLVAGADLSLVHCPETALPGDLLAELRTNDRIVGAVASDTGESARALYRSATDGEVHLCRDARTAEFVKLVQNTYRTTNIALANDIAKLAAEHGVDSRSAIALANHHPRVDLLDPGPGVGGHCLPIDPYFLFQDADAGGLIERACGVNESMPEYVADRIFDRCELGTNLRVAVLGVAYKGNVADVRESPGLNVADTLRERVRTGALSADGGAEVDVRLHDPHVSDESLSLRSLPDALGGADAVVIAADHDEYAALDPETVRERMRGRYVLDGRAILDRGRWESRGITVDQL